MKQWRTQRRRVEIISCRTCASPTTWRGDLHAQMASGEVGATTAGHTLCGTHHGLDDIEESRRRDHHPVRRGHPGEHSRDYRAGPTRPARCSTLPTAAKIDIVCALTMSTAELGGDHGRLRRHVRGVAVGHQRGDELHPRVHDVHGALGAESRHPEQPRQPRPDQGEGSRTGRIVNAVLRRSRVRPAMSWGCSCRTRC